MGAEQKLEALNGGHLRPRVLETAKRRVARQRALVIPRRSARLAAPAVVLETEQTDCGHGRDDGVGEAEAEAEADEDGVVEREAAEGPGPAARVHELKIWLEGEVFKFDSVPSEKVQVVLLLLAGREVAPDFIPSPSSSDVQNEDVDFPQRVRPWTRSQKKRKELNFGPWTRSQKKRKELNFGEKRFNDTRGEGTVRCHHCGIHAISTRKMRRGPDKPRSLCNACGFSQAKGTMRDL